MDQVVPQAYLDDMGREVFVGQGIGRDSWGAFRSAGYGGISRHRVCSPMLPMVTTRCEAQRNLDLYARHRKGWKKINTCRIGGCTDRRACPGGCTWAELNLCSRCVDKETL